MAPYRLNTLLWKSTKSFIQNWKLIIWWAFYYMILTIAFTIILFFFGRQTKDWDVIEYDQIKLNTLETFNSDFGIPERKILYSPQNPYLENIIKGAVELLDLEGYVAYKSADDLESALLKTDTFAGVEFDKSHARLSEYPKFLIFSLRFPGALRHKISMVTATAETDKSTWLTNKLAYTEGSIRLPEENDGGVPVGYYREGFLPLQSAISKTFINLTKQISKEVPDVELNRFPYPYQKDIPIKSFKTFFLAEIFLFVGHIGLIPLTSIIFEEREKHLKEAQHLMGISGPLQLVSWCILGFCLSFLLALIAYTLSRTLFNDLCGSSDDLVLFLLFFIYYFSLFLFLLCLTSLLQRSPDGIVTIAVISMLIIIPALLFDTYALYCIPSCALFYFVRIILFTEAQESGIQWSNIFYKLVFGVQINVGLILICMVVCWLLYWVLYWYFGKIVPPRYVGGRSWNFPFKQKYWTRKIRKHQKYFDIEKTQEKQTKNEKLFDIDPLGKEIGIEIIDLSKKYEHWVLKNISLKMFEGEVTVILGNNSAGKSTLISILTGTMPANKGKVLISNYDISRRKKRNEARLIMGICTQHNILFENLTVAQNIRFHVVLKDIDDREVKYVVESFLEKLNLVEKRKLLCKYLSTSEKRMLSVGCAFCGFPKVVFLDEPTFGMDATTKHQFWSFLAREKIGKTILIATKNSEEANILADRIAVLHSGEIKCYGSTNFLKNNVGEGYYLICNKGEDCDVKLINKTLAKLVPDIKPMTENASEVVYGIPKDKGKQIQSVLQQLEKQKTSMGIMELGVGTTSIEYILLKYGSDRFRRIADPFHEACGVFDLKVTFKNGERIQSTMLMKRIKILSGRLWIFLILLLFPILYVLIVVILNLGIEITEPPALPITIRVYPKVIFPIFVEQNLTKEFDYEEELKSAVKSDGGNFVLDKADGSDFGQFILDLGIKDQAIINAHYVAGVACTSSGVVVWFNNQFYHSAPLGVNILYNALARHFIGPTSGIKVYNKPLPIGRKYMNEFLKLFPSLHVAQAVILGLTVSMVLMLPSYIKERTTKAKIIQNLRGVNFRNYWLPSFFIDYAIYFLLLIIIFIIVTCGRLEGLESSDVLTLHFLSMMCFGFAAFPLLYFLQTLSSNSTMVVMFILFLAYISLVLGVFVRNAVLQKILMILPFYAAYYTWGMLFNNYALHDGCEELADHMSDKQLCADFDYCCHRTSYLSFSEPGIMLHLIWFMICGSFWWVMVYLMDQKYLGYLLVNCMNLMHKKPELKDRDDLESEVQGQREKIAFMPKEYRSDYPVIYDEVTKYYGNSKAVNQLFLVVERGECFGIYGGQRVGKSTVIKMALGDKILNYGNLYINGKSTKNEWKKIVWNCCYVPQYDGLFEELTGSENIRVYARIRGFNTNRINQMIQELGVALVLTEELENRVSTYSLGSKRRLNMAIAMIGAPDLIFIDEPTTEIDPFSKHLVWNMIECLRLNGTTIILTSSQIEECKMLCSRFSIMENGELICLGSMEQLNTKFCEDFTLNIKLLPQKLSTRRVSVRQRSLLSYRDVNVFEDPNLSIESQKAKELLKKNFPNATLKQEFDGALSYIVPKTDVQFSKVFNTLLQMSESLGLEEFSLYQTKFEDKIIDLTSEKPKEMETTVVQKNQPKEQHLEQQPDVSAIVEEEEDDEERTETFENKNIYK